MYVKTLPGEHLFLAGLSLMAGQSSLLQHIRKYYVISGIKIAKFVADDFNS